MIRRAAFLLALVLLLSFGAYKQQSAPVTVVCGTVSGGHLMTAKGVDWAQRAGSWVRNVIDKPEEYRDRDSVKEVLDGMFRKVLWYWIKSGVQSARGEKIDPQIVRLQKEQQQAEQDALAACCPATPLAPEEDEAPEWDSRNASLSTASRFTAENGRIAQAAIREVRRARMPERAAVVMLAAGFVESGVRSLTYGDRDSIGWLQQRNAWGSRADRLDPAKAARMFLYGGAAGQEGLRDKNWQQMSVGQAAQAVQVSAFPDRYAAYEDDARALMAAVGGFGSAVESPEAPGYTAGQCAQPGETVSGSPSAAMTPTPGGWDFPGQRSVDAAIAWMRDQDQRNTGGWQNRCLAAVGQAYGHPGTTPVDGHFYAVGQWTAMPTRYRSPGMSNPPRGALVFWTTSDPAGHIAISNGDGRVWTTDPPGRSGQIGLVDVDTIDTWGKRLGYGAPWFVGKTGAQA
jgi:hypothetical protein